MGELDREYVWFRPMMDTIAQRLLESVGWGLKMRLYTGAGLSTLDLLSDLYMVYTYATTGQQGTALSLSIMVGLCLLLQLGVVWGQARKAPGRVILKEMLIVLSGIAPGIHSMRVARGAKQSEYAAMDPELELTFTRGIEMVLESIPGCVLQLHAFLPTLKAAGGYDKRALASIIVSALTTGFSAATISFDFDVNPKRRKDEPAFYGYIPDSASARTMVFGCMVINGALLLLVRSASTALLAMVGAKYVAAYYVGDMAAEAAFGKGAPEAVLAWSEVEDVAASARAPDMSAQSEECDIESEACVDYHEKVAELEKLIKSQTGAFERMKKLAGEVYAVPRAVKMVAATPSSGTKFTPFAATVLETSIKEAKAATAKFGATSPEAAIAWEDVEELSSSSNAAAVQPALGDECLLELQEACEAMEELQAKILREQGMI
ncbi:hypothetical protein TeGR_g3036 [Tetraparma gracilis]|uniref:Uncharacterized protein n=1 Tax=Tetraparma gracilis TaxID=2962635 RepID=A0ABQ6MUJ6_9STRA|nr:hypothetical protein TeGR_g3036 [Tetraparma gracilis]